MSGRLIATTERLIIREFIEADAPAFFVLGSHPDIIRYTGDPGGGLQSVEHAAEVLSRHALADYAQHGFGRWACVDRQTGAVIGSAGLKWLAEFGEVDLGFRFLPSYWGAGLATEAGRTILAYAFGPLKLQQVIGLVDPSNVASQRVLEKLGFKSDGVIDDEGEPTLRYIIHGMS